MTCSILIYSLDELKKTCLVWSCPAIINLQPEVVWSTDQSFLQYITHPCIRVNKHIFFVKYYLPVATANQEKSMMLFPSSAFL